VATSSGIGGTITAISASIVGLAALAVIFGTNSQTAQVLQAAGTAYSGILNAALSPVAGGGGASGVTGNLGNQDEWE
jgi:hypothetical protein